jgi:hypothetical protein
MLLPLQQHSRISLTSSWHGALLIGTGTNLPLIKDYKLINLISRFISNIDLCIITITICLDSSYIKNARYNINISRNLNVSNC